jgi:adenylate cyclase
VWRGQIRQGDSEVLEAAICFCDLRRFTELSTELDQKELLALINDVFAQLVNCISAHGGQVLKFMGDGLLAIFSDKKGLSQCEPAIHAAKDAIAAIATLRSRRAVQDKVTPEVGIGLHYGQVLYGNVGAPGRLDFTVIGSAVNQTARIEGLCSRTGQSILMSDTFAETINTLEYPQGKFEVKGFPKPILIYGVAPNHRGKKTPA